MKKKKNETNNKERKKRTRRIYQYTSQFSQIYIHLINKSCNTARLSSSQSYCKRGCNEQLKAATMP